MSDFFSLLYENFLGLYSQDYALIYDELYKYGGYLLLGLAVLLIPLLTFAAFYFLWKNPYGHFGHWALWLLVTALLVAVASFAVLYQIGLNPKVDDLYSVLLDPATGYSEYLTFLSWIIPLINAFFAVVLGFIYSLVMKLFSKNHMHLPF